MAERYAYNPYGAVSIFTAAWATQLSTVYNNEILFAGYRQDTESGLYHVRRRAYHPTLGRFVQRDPAGYHDGMNLYEYAGSFPTMTTDPSGMLRIVNNMYGTDPRVLFNNGTFSLNGSDVIASTYVPQIISLSSVFAIAGLGGFCPTCNVTAPIVVSAAGGASDPGLIATYGMNSGSSQDPTTGDASGAPVTRNGDGGTRGLMKVKVEGGVAKALIVALGSSSATVSAIVITGWRIEGKTVFGTDLNAPGAVVDFNPNPEAQSYNWGDYTQGVKFTGVTQLANLAKNSFGGATITFFEVFSKITFSDNTTIPIEASVSGLSVSGQ